MFNPEILVGVKDTKKIVVTKTNGTKVVLKWWYNEYGIVGGYNAALTRLPRVAIKHKDIESVALFDSAPLLEGVDLSQPIMVTELTGKVQMFNRALLFDGIDEICGAKGGARALYRFNVRLANVESIKNV